MAPAHAIENKSETACRRGDLFMKRKTMMKAWDEYLHSKSNGSNV